MMYQKACPFMMKIANDILHTQMMLAEIGKLGR